jgi:branched-chain amino acid transport system substrate-binding protein
MTMPRRFAALAVAGTLILAACTDDDTSTAPASGTISGPTASADDTSDDNVADEPAPDVTVGDPATSSPGTDATPTSSNEPEGDTFEVDLDACDDPDVVSAPIEGEIVIGQSLPLSGGPAVVLAPFADGFRAYLDHYNDTTGGIEGTHEVTVRVTDDQHSSELARSNVDSLLFDDGAQLLAGIVGTSTNAAVSDDLDGQCVPQLWAASGSARWGQVDEHPWVTGLMVPFPVEVEAYLTHAAGVLPDGGRLGLFVVDDESGRELADAVTARADEFGFQIVATETVDPSDVTVPTGQVDALVDADVDLVVAAPLGAQAISLLTAVGAARSEGDDFDPIVYVVSSVADPLVFGSVAGNGADGVITSTNLRDVTETAAADPAVATFREALAALGSGAPADGIAATGWHAAELTVHVLEQAAATGELSRRTIIEAARNLDVAPSLIRDGLRMRMDRNDGYAAEATQLRAWSTAESRFVDIGEPVDLEGFLGVAE